jgi:hypothetical protein
MERPYIHGCLWCPDPYVVSLYRVDRSRDRLRAKLDYFSIANAKGSKKHSPIQNKNFTQTLEGFVENDLRSEHLLSF